MKYAKILAVLGGLALVGAGSATLLDVFGTISGTADVEPVVQLREVQYNPSDESTQEYIRVVNTADVEVDLAGWSLKDNDTADTLSSFNSSYDTVLMPGEEAYITESEGNADVDVPLNKARLATDNAVGSGGLSNSGEIVKLKYTDGSVISSVNYISASCSTSDSYQRSSYTDSWSCSSASIGGGSQ